MAQLTIDLSRIRDNIDALLRACAGHGVDVAGIVKPCQDFDPIVEVYNTHSGLSCLGISKVGAGRRLDGQVDKPLLLTCVPRPDHVDDVVRYCDVSLNSELETIERLADACDRLGRSHAVLLMVEVGDLREGVLPDDVVPLAARILEMGERGLRFAGIGANYGCVNGVLPNAANMALMETLAGRLAEDLGVRPETVSLGGSVVLDWMDRYGLPPCVNQIRIGEPILLGTLSGAEQRYRDLHRDALAFEATVVEVKRKPSYPAGEKTGDAFGVRHEREDRGIRTRALLDFGVVDTDPASLRVTVPGLTMITSNSDYTVVDTTDCAHSYRVGDTISFGLKYKSMLQCFTNGLLQKEIRSSGREAVDGLDLDKALALAAIPAERERPLNHSL